jgi:hypothetical protein
VSILAIIAIIILAVLAICRYLGPRAQLMWFCSSGEEKIGLSKNKLYNANGYIVSRVALISLLFLLYVFKHVT